MRILLGLFALLCLSILYLIQPATKEHALEVPAQAENISIQQIESSAISAVPAAEQGATIIEPAQQVVSEDEELSEQLCASYTKPVCQLRDDIQLQQHLIRNNNLFMNSAALVLGSSNFEEALLQLSASKTANEDFSTEQDIQDYLIQELSGEVYTLQLGCGEGICMAGIKTGPDSDLERDLKKLQGFGSSVMAEFEHTDHKELRIIFLTGKNANNGMTGTSNKAP